ncbi:MAG: 2-oxo acid dehydrogenase subunit E2, partial [Verrucomicrobiales bacterium]
PTIPILMPQLGESIAEANVIQIHVAPGDAVEADQEVIEVETNKAVMGVTTPCSGRVTEVSAELEKNYLVGATLARLEVSQQEADRLGIETCESASSSEPPTGQPLPDSPTDSEPSDNIHFRVKRDAEIEGGGEVQPTVQGLPVPANTTGATYLSPRMKARMAELGLNASDLSGVAGSGAGGRVTIEDFEKFIADIETKKTTAASPMRIAVADSMRRSWSRPLATVGAPFPMDALLDHRRSVDPKPGPALYTIRALALALAENTAVAGRLIGASIVHPDSIDIGFAVEVDDGVLVPIIRDADKKPLADLVGEYDTLVKQARDRRLSRDAIRTGIATVTNFGTFGIVWATPIPLPEQNLVLGLGTGRKKPVWNEAKGEFVPVTEANLTLSFDHRILDGGAAGRLLARINDLLQEPDAL